MPEKRPPSRKNKESCECDCAVCDIGDHQYCRNEEKCTIGKTWRKPKKPKKR